MFDEPHSYTGNDLGPYMAGGLSREDLRYADLTETTLIRADLTDATFNTGTKLRDGQTVAQHGFDARPGGLPGGRSCECMGSR
jgi:hypothetical protein